MNGRRLARDLACATAWALCVTAGAADIVRDPFRPAAGAGAAQFDRVMHDGNPPVLGWTRNIAQARHINVYVEGDGRPWLGNRRAPRDPTPRTSLVVEIARADPGPVIYLARPCQYLNRGAMPSCEPRWWTHDRYSVQAVEVMNTTLDAMLSVAPDAAVVLIGHSGGGTMATLLAAHRTDVRALLSIGAVLDTVQWARSHGVTPLENALNPADFAARLARIPQVHLFGARDDIAPAALARVYVEGVGRTPNIAFIEVAGFNHQCCWDRAALLRHACSSSVPLPPGLCADPAR